MVVIVPRGTLTGWDASMRVETPGEDPGVATLALGVGFDGTPNAAVYATSSGVLGSNQMIINYSFPVPTDLSFYLSLILKKLGPDTLCNMRLRDAAGLFSDFIALSPSSNFTDAVIDLSTITTIIDLTRVVRVTITVFTYGVVATWAFDNIEAIAPATPTVTFNSSPTGVPITVNGSPIGNTPVAIQVDFEQQITVEAPQEVEV